VPLFVLLGLDDRCTRQQLFNGALLVVFALAICVRDAVDKLRFAPQISNQGLALIAVGARVPVAGGAVAVWLLPLVLFRLVCICGPWVSFVLGKVGVAVHRPSRFDVDGQAAELRRWRGRFGANAATRAAELLC